MAASCLAQIVAVLRRHLLPGVLAAAAVIFATASHAQAQQQQSSPEARIVVIGTGSVSLPPDSAQISGGVTTRAKTAKEASDANAKTMAAITAALASSGIEQKDIQTARFSVQPIYTPPQTNAEPKLAGFSVSNQVRVRIRQVADIGEVLDRLIAAGATDLGNVEFMHSDLSKALDQARQAAFTDAKRKAELYAQAAGLALGPVVWISEDSVAAPVTPFAPRALAAPAAVPIAGGEDTLHATVTVGFDVTH